MSAVLTEADYRAHRAVSASDVKAASIDYEAWAFERRLKLSGETPPWMRKEPSPAMEFGTAVHMAVLQPDEYLKKAVIMPYVENFALKAGKDIKKEFEAYLGTVPGSFLLRAEQSWAIDRIRENYLEATDEFDFRQAVIETPVFKGYGDHTIKGMPDAVTPKMIFDVKTTRDIHRIRQTTEDFAYNVQLAHYSYLTGVDRWQYIYIENQAPYRVRVLEVFPDEIEDAHERWRQTIGRIIEDGLI